MSKRIRQRILETAIDIIMHDRNVSHGEPEDNFGDIAAFWTLVLKDLLKPGVVIRPHHVAIMSICIKLARLRFSPDREDHWVDVAGYSACGYEVFKAEAVAEKAAQSGQMPLPFGPRSWEKYDKLISDLLSDPFEDNPSEANWNDDWYQPPLDY